MNLSRLKGADPRATQRPIGPLSEANTTFLHNLRRSRAFFSLTAMA